MATPRHPYLNLEDRAFWSRAVAGRHATEMGDLFRDGSDLGLDSGRIATAGSCFAQHIGRALRDRGLKYMDYEPAPPFLDADQADQLGYGVYSCRYGNVYTVRQLLQLFEEAHGRREPADLCWTRGDEVYDALRPGVQCFGSEEEMRTLRRHHLERVAALFRDLDVFVFTLGLTEAWLSTKDGTAYPTAPGVIAGRYDPAGYVFHNTRHAEVLADLETFLAGLKAVNPAARLLLTVSPVPLAATAGGEHVLCATTYSKSVLRAAAGELQAAHHDVFYFPSYEIITGQQSRHMYYNPDLRTVCAAGVAHVMCHFFAGQSTVARAPATTSVEFDDGGYEHCEESLLDRKDGNGH